MVEVKKKKSPPDKQRRAKSKVSPRVSTVDLETTMSLKYIAQLFFPSTGPECLETQVCLLSSGTDPFFLNKKVKTLPYDLGAWKKKGSLNFFNLFVFSSQRLFYGLKTPDFSC